MTNYKTFLKRTDNNSLATIGMRVFETVNTTGCEKIFNNPTYIEFVNNNINFQRSVAQKIILEIKEKINFYKQARKQIFLELHSYVKGMVLCPNSTTRKSAENVFAVLDMFGKGFLDKRIVDQKLCYSRIIKKLNNPELTNDFEKLEITESVQNLIQIQQNIDAKSLELLYAKVEYPSASSVRKDFDKALINFLDNLRTLKDCDDEPTIKEVFENILQMLDVVQLSAYRKNKKPNKSDNDSESECKSDSEDNISA